MKIINALVLCFSVIMHAQEDKAKTYKPVEYPDGYTARLNVSYTGGPAWDKKLDLYLPDPKKKPSPVLINIHGGGWNHGVKESQTGFKLFFNLGYAIANIEYRLTPEATAPAAVEDARCALVYIITHAKELNIDTSKIVIKGGSAGGHLALMSGLLGNNHIFDTNCQTSLNSNVAAIIVGEAVTDLEPGFGSDAKQYGSARKWLGRYSTDIDFVRSVSPVNYINSSSPPVFISHGDADKVVPYSQAVLLHQKLTDAGVKTVFITKKGGGHGIPDPKEVKDNINKEIVTFLRELGLYNE